MDKPISLDDVIVDPKSIDFYTKITSQGQDLQTIEPPERIDNTLNQSNLETIELPFSEIHNMKINIRNTDTKIISTRRDRVSFAIKTLVENNSDSANVSFLLQGFDNEGFLFYEIKINEVIPIGESIVINAKEDFVEQELFNKIVEWRIKSKEESGGMGAVPAGYEDFDDGIPF